MFNLLIEFLSTIHLISKQKIDVLVVEGLGASNVAIVAARLMGKTVFYDYSDYYPDFIRAYTPGGFVGAVATLAGKLLDIFNLKLATAITTVSRMLTDFVKPYNSKVFEVSNGVSESILGPASTNQICNLSNSNKPLTLGFVGTLETWVSLEMVIDCISELNKTGRIDATLIVIGDGPRKNYFQKYACNHKVADKVEFTGWVPYNQLFSILQKIDVCVLPFDKSNISIFSMPMKIHEYALFKKPIISSPLPEVIRTYGKNVLYASSSEEYVSQVKLFIKNSFSVNLIENSFKIAQSYSWTILSESYSNLFTKVSSV